MNHRLYEAKTNSLAAAVLLELMAQLWLFGASAAYHRGNWSLWGEALAARIDYVGVWRLSLSRSLRSFVFVFSTTRLGYVGM